MIGRSGSTGYGVIMIRDDDPRLGMREADLQAAVLDLASRLHWESYHTRNSVGSRAGFPDLVLWHTMQQRRMFVELKSTRGILRADQDRTLASLAAAGAEVYVWRPMHWLTGEIEWLLRQPREES